MHLSGCAEGVAWNGPLPDYESWTKCWRDSPRHAGMYKGCLKPGSELQGLYLRQRQISFTILVNSRTTMKFSAIFLTIFTLAASGIYADCRDDCRERWLFALSLDTVLLSALVAALRWISHEGKCLFLSLRRKSNGHDDLSFDEPLTLITYYL